MRKTAALFIILCCCIPASAYALTCIWTERWDVKTLADKDAAKVDFRPGKSSVHKLVGLKTVVPPLDAPRQGVEFQTFEVICRIKHYSVALDGDINLVLVDPLHRDDMMIAEIPDPKCPRVRESRYAKDFRRVREEFSRYCLRGGKVNKDGDDHPVKKGLYVVTGVGFVDIPHFMEGKAPNNIEIHPVLSISEFYP